MSAASGDMELVDDFGILCWLLKDAGWVVLCPVVSIPAAAAALTAEIRQLINGWPTLSMAQQMHCLAVVLWLAGNSVWMCGELLFEPSEGAGRLFPWFNGPVLGANEAASAMLLRVAQAFFMVGFLVLLPCYAAYARALLRLRSQEALRVPEVRAVNGQEKVFGVIEPDVYEMLFIGPWILKDLCWSLEGLGGALLCSACVVALISDGLRRFRNPRTAAELLWVAGNTIWVVAELAFLDRLLWLRALACVVLLLGLIPLVSAIRNTWSSTRPDESSYLLEKGAK